MLGVHLKRGPSTRRMSQPRGEQAKASPVVGRAWEGPAESLTSTLSRSRAGVASGDSQKGSVLARITPGHTCMVAGASRGIGLPPASLPLAERDVVWTL